MSSDHDQFDRILQLCLDLVQSGEETVDSVVARYPEYADELRSLLSVAGWLESRRDTLDPRPGFVSASRNRLIAQIKQEEQETRRRKTSPFWSLWPSRMSYSLGLAFVIFMILFISSSGVALAAQSAIPGDALYPVKIALEKVALSVPMDETKNAQLAMEFTQRRSVEINQLVEIGRIEYIKGSVINYQDQIKDTLQTLDDIADTNDNAAKALAASFQDDLSHQNSNLSSLMVKVPGSAKPAISQAISVAEEGVHQTERLINKASSSPVSTATPFPTPTHSFRGGVAATSTPVPTNTLRPTPTSAPTMTSVPPTRTKEPTSAPLPTATAVPPTRTFTPTATKVQEPPTEAPTFTPTATPTDVPTATATPRPSDTPTDIPTEIPTDIPTDVPTAVPSDTPVPPPTDTRTPVPTDVSTPVAPNTDTAVPAAINATFMPTANPATTSVLAPARELNIENWDNRN